MRSTILIAFAFGLITFSSCEKLEFLDKKDKKEFDKKKDHDYDKKEVNKICFDLVYPVTYSLPDESSVTGSEMELEIAIKDWYLANPDSEEKYHLQYPVDIVFEDGTTETIDEADEMIAAKKSCE